MLLYSVVNSGVGSTPKVINGVFQSGKVYHGRYFFSFLINEQYLLRSLSTVSH